MSRNCLQIEELIWEHTRTGAGLDLETLNHIDSCPKCAHTLKETMQISSALKTAIDVPSAPDCRAAVAVRISPNPRFAWNYALGTAIILLMVIGLAKIVLSPVKDTQHIAKKPVHHKRTVKIARKVTPIKTANVEIKTNKTQHRHPKIKPAGHKRLYTALKIKHVKLTPVPVKDKHLHKQINKIVQRSPEPEAIQTPQVVEQNKVIIQDSVINRPVAIAVVHWPTADDKPSTDCDYSYSERNTKTGETTICSVKRSGNSIEINLKTEPEKKEEPVKRSMNYEKSPSA